MCASLDRMWHQQAHQHPHHGQEKSKAKRTWLRTFLMHGFHFLVGLVVGHQIRDTQCGFKVASGSACGASAVHWMVLGEVELVYIGWVWSAGRQLVWLANCRTPPPYLALT